MILEKLVKMSPSDKDDILLDVVVQGLTKMVKGEKKWKLVNVVVQDSVNLDTRITICVVPVMNTQNQ